MILRERVKSWWLTNLSRLFGNISGVFFCCCFFKPDTKGVPSNISQVRVGKLGAFFRLGHGESWVLQGSYAVLELGFLKCKDWKSVKVDFLFLLFFFYIEELIFGRT